MGVIIKSAVCIAVLTAISPLNDSQIDAAAIAKVAAPFAASPALIQHGAALCAQNPSQCRDRASALTGASNEISKAIASRAPGG